MSNSSAPLATGRYRFETDASAPGQTLGNVMKMMTVWNARTMSFSTMPRHPEYDVFEFVEQVEFMQCTGGNASRDLFKDPDDVSVMDDYDFQPLLKEIAGVLRLGAKPYLKIGNVPRKLAGAFNGGEFSINIYPPVDWAAHAAYMRAFAHALVDTFGRDEVRSWRFALLTEADNAGWFQARNGEAAETFAAFCRLYAETYQAFAVEIGTGFVWGTHMLGVPYGPGQRLRWSADAFCAFCEREGLPLDLLAISFYDRVGAQPRAERLEDQVIGAWREATKRHGFHKVIWGYDEGRIIVATPGKDRSDLVPRVMGDSFQASYDARLTKNLFDLDVDYFAAWNYFCSGPTTNDLLPNVSYFVAREAAAFKGLRRLPLSIVSAEGAETDEETDGVAALSPDGTHLRAMLYNFRNCTNYRHPVDTSLSVCGAFLPGARVRVVRTVVDTTVNWFDTWKDDRVRLGIADSDFSWSPDGPTPLHPNGLLNPEHRRLFIETLLPKYREIAKVKPVAFETTVGADGTLQLEARLLGNAVAFFDVRTDAD